MERTVSNRMHVIFIDGCCVFCNRLARFIMRADKRRQFRFAHLQGTFAKAVLARLDADAMNIDSIYVLIDAGTSSERLFSEGEAAREIWPRIFRGFAVLRIVPLPILNLFYRLFARFRYRLFGKYEQCVLPSAQESERFIADT